MNELSNRTLALLLVLAIIFSLGGTLLALGRISKLGITGMVTNTTSGYVNLSITQRVCINLTTASVNFGSGYVGMGCSNCTMETFGGISNFAGCCISFVAPATGLVIENTGNTALQVNANFTNSSFIGGTNSQFRMKVINNESQSCATLGATWSPDYATVPTYNAGSENLGLICDRLTPNQANDTIQLHINITIPDNAVSGDKNCSVLVTGTGL